MAKAHKSPWTWLLLILLLIILLLLGIVLGWWGGDGDGEATPTANETTAATEPAGPSGQDFVARPVTSGNYLPPANALTEDALDGVGAGWVLAIHSDDAYADGGLFTPGDSVLYLIEPDGTQYEVANLDSFGWDSPDLVAWSGPRDLALLVEDRSELHVVSLVTGAIVNSWTFCGEAGSVRGFSAGDNWVLRGACSGDGIDGLYDDAGATLASNITGDEFGDSVVDVGEVQVITGFETFPEDRFEAVYADGTTAALPPPAGLDCYPIGKGRGPTVAIACYSSSDTPDIFELPVDGSPAVPVIASGQLDTFKASLGYDAGDYLGVTGYCSDSVFSVVETSGFEERLGVNAGADVVDTLTPPFVHQKCHAAVGTGSLVSGNGPLWWIDWDTGVTVELLPGSGDEFPLYVVGAAETTALLHP